VLWLTERETAVVGGWGVGVVADSVVKNISSSIRVQEHCSFFTTLSLVVVMFSSVTEWSRVQGRFLLCFTTLFLLISFNFF
jgi:hypothetical protein